MNFFEGLSKEAQALISVLGQPKPIVPVYQIKLNITHVFHGHTIEENLTLPHKYTSATNATVTYTELKAMSTDDILYVARDFHPHLREVKNLELKLVSL